MDDNKEIGTLLSQYSPTLIPGDEEQLKKGMRECYILESASDLNLIENLGDDFYIFIIKNGWIKFFITPSSLFKDSYNVYDNRNELIDCYDSIVDAVQHIFKIL